jgi:hypothetical protein
LKVVGFNSPLSPVHMHFRLPFDVEPSLEARKRREWFGEFLE